MPIGRVQRGDVALPEIARVAQTFLAPGEARAVQPHDQQIRHEAGMSPITVRKRVNVGQPVMEAKRDFIGRIHPIETVA